MDSSFHNLDVIRALPHDGKSIAIFSYPDLQDVNYAGKLISNRFIRARLVLCYPKQLVEQSWNVALIPQHTAFRQARSESEYSVESS
jgi:hypothetical protein